jgi:hypothetical protein
MIDVHGDGAPKGILMVMKNKLHLFYVIKDAGGHMARAERIFKSPIVLEIYQITTVIYTQLRNNRLIKNNVCIKKNEGQI